jgi:hypothetical protein
MQMQQAGFLLGTLTILAAAGGITSALLQIRMVEKLNALLPAEERFSLLGWYFGKLLRFSRLYRARFPHDLLWRAWMSTITGLFVALLAAASTLLYWHQ